MNVCLYSPIIRAMLNVCQRFRNGKRGKNINNIIEWFFFRCNYECVCIWENVKCFNHRTNHGLNLFKIAGGKKCPDLFAPSTEH